ncbi:DUF2958 domain-containing protein, partial [Acidithiobacillus sp.]
MPKFWIDLSAYNMELLVIGRQPDRRLALIPMDKNKPMRWPDQEFLDFPAFTPADAAQEIWVSDLPLSAALLRRDLWTGEFPDAVFRDGGDLLRDVSVPDVAAALALPGQNFKATPPPLRKVPAVLRPFLSQSQIRATEDGLRGEEKDFFAERMDTLAEMIAVMPKTYESDGKGDQAMVHLHYFHRGADWYITEKDSDPDGTGQVQAFGLADLGMDYPEMGYISIQEITRLGAEMDYHFAPRSLLELKKEKYPEMVPGAPVAEALPDNRSAAVTIEMDHAVPLDQWPDMTIAQLGFSWRNVASGREMVFETSQGPSPVLFVDGSDRMRIFDAQEALSSAVIQRVVLPLLSMHCKDWETALRDGGVNTRSLALPDDAEVVERANRWLNLLSGETAADVPQSNPALQEPLREIPEQLRPFIAATEVRHWTDVLNEKSATPPNTSIMEVRSRMEAIQAWLLRGSAAQMQAASDAGMNATAVLYLHDMASGADYALTATQQEPGKRAVAYGLSWNASAADVSSMVSPIDLQSLMDG